MFSDYEHARLEARRQIELFEYWAKGLIHNILSKEYGLNYFEHQFDDGNYLIKKDIRSSTQKMCEDHPGRYTRRVDSLFIDEIISILANPNLYKFHFSDALNHGYPDGVNELRTFLSRMIEPRNHLSHSNMISYRQAEQVICYSNDFIDTVKKYYERENLQMEYNVPKVVRVFDSLGNEVYRDQLQESNSGVFWQRVNRLQLRPGERIRFDIEVDSSFSEDEYTLSWSGPNLNFVDFKNKPYVDFEIENKHVNQNFILACKIKSNKDWHRLHDCDDKIHISFTILPPV